jgi:hypothetical protein
MMHNNDNYICRRRGLKEGEMRIKRRRKIKVGREIKRGGIKVKEMEKTRERIKT